MPQTPTARALTRGILAGAAVYSASRGIAYAVPRDLQDPLIAASFGGMLIPLYAGLWFLSAGLCLWEMRLPTLHGRGLPSMVGMMTLWGAAWLAGWVVHLFHGNVTLWWQTGLTYLGPAFIIVCLLRLHALILKHIGLAQTGGIPRA